MMNEFQGPLPHDRPSNIHDRYSAWGRYTDRGGIVLCDSDAPKAFKLFRQNVVDDALESAAVIADKHWPESGHVPQQGAVSCAMSISIEIRRLRSDYPKPHPVNEQADTKGDR